MPSRTRKQKGHRRLDGGAPKAEGVASELRERYALCTTDLETAARFPSKTLSSALFLFFATLFSTVALGAHIQQETGNRIGLSEYLLANALGGAFHAMFGAQPLLILRPTGPITAIMGKLSTLADAVELDFYQLLAATGVCVSALMFAVAYWRLSTFARRFTPFTLDIFACFVCSIYVFDGVHDVWQRLDLASMATVGRSLLDLNLALVTFAVSVKLQAATSWRCLFPSLRQLLSDYAVTIAVVSATLCSYSIEVAIDTVLRIDLPPHLGPSCELDATIAHSLPPSAIGHACLAERASRSPPLLDTTAASTTTQPAAGGEASVPRPWLIDLGALLTAGPTLWGTALVASVPIAFFFYFDQNISNLFCQREPGGLARGRYMHSAFVALGIVNLLGPLCGLPFLTGSLPHSPQFVRALTVPTGRASGAVEVAESRVAPLLVYGLIGMPLLAPWLLLAIPGAAIDGVLIFVGYEGIVGTGLFARTLMMLTPKYEFDLSFKGLRKRRISLYTATQLSLFGACWAINLSPAGLAVAFLIVALVPMRERALPRLFTENELSRLDEMPTSPDGPSTTDGLQRWAGDEAEMEAEMEDADDGTDEDIVNNAPASAADDLEAGEDAATCPTTADHDDGQVAVDVEAAEVTEVAAAVTVAATAEGPAAAVGEVRGSAARPAAGEAKVAAHVGGDLD